MPATLRYRRAAHLVSYWTPSGMVTRNYAAGSAVLNDPVVTYALSMCGDTQMLS